MALNTITASMPSHCRIASIQIHPRHGLELPRWYQAKSDNCGETVV